MFSRLFRNTKQDSVSAWVQGLTEGDPVAIGLTVVVVGLLVIFGVIYTKDRRKSG